MRPIALSDEVAVGEVPQADEIPILAKAGFRALINVQPEGEVMRLTDAASCQLAAAAAGLAYVHVPIESRLPSEARITAFADALATLPRPVYAWRR
jgi:sulfide:quinone oxidoreductase